MAVPKYLRYLTVDLDAAPNPEPFRAAPVHHIPFLLERLITPMASPGVAKLVVILSPTRTSPAVEKDALGVASVGWPFPLEQFQQLAPSEQPAHYLQSIRGAVQFAAQNFGWDLARLDSACEEIRSAGFTASFSWPSKPKFDPQRRRRARVLVEVADTSRLSLVFGDRSGELQRTVVTHLGRGVTSGVLTDVLGELRWESPEAVSLFLRNGRDHWLVSPNGSVEFIFPMARPDNAQGLYQFGKLLWEGRYVDMNPDRALELIRQSAVLGDKHAQRFIEEVGEP